MRTKLLALSALLAAGLGANAETVLDIGKATDIWGYSYVEQSTFLQAGYKVSPVQEFKVDGYTIYVQATSSYYNPVLVCVDPEIPTAYFGWRGINYIEITAPKGEFIDSFALYCDGPEDAKPIGNVDGQNVNLTVVEDLNMASTLPAIGEVSYSEPMQMEIYWVNTTGKALNKICIRTPAFSRRDIYKIAINGNYGPEQCSMTPTPGPSHTLYAGDCGTAENPEGLANLRIDFDQTGVTVNPEAFDVIYLTLNDALIYSWEDPEIVTGTTDYALLPGLNAGLLRTPGTYELTVPTGFFMYDGREVNGGTVSYKLEPKTTEMITGFAPEYENGNTMINAVELTVASEYSSLVATEAFKFDIFKENVIQPVSAGFMESFNAESGVMKMNLLNTIEGPGNFEAELAAGSLMVCLGSEEWGPYLYNERFVGSFSLSDSGVDETGTAAETFNVFGVDGTIVKRGAENISDLPAGLYIVNGKKVVIRR